MTKPILCMDFDGVLHSYSSGWKGASIIPDPPVPGAIAFLLEATYHFDVCIFSSRSNQPGGVEAMRTWLLDCAIDPEGNNAWLQEIRFPTEKPAAFLSIDDRAITFTGVFPDPGDLLGFKPWNKQ